MHFFRSLTLVAATLLLIISSTNASPLPKGGGHGGGGGGRGFFSGGGGSGGGEGGLVGFFTRIFRGRNPHPAGLVGGPDRVLTEYARVSFLSSLSPFLPLKMY